MPRSEPGRGARRKRVRALLGARRKRVRALLGARRKRVRALLGARRKKVQSNSMRPEAQTKMSSPTHNSTHSSIQTSSITSISGCLLDLYPSLHGMTLWLIGPNQTRHRLIDRFAPAFYVSGP